MPDFQAKGKQKPGSTVEFLFPTFDSNDPSASVTTTLAVGDVKVFKDGGTTARASTAGFTVDNDFSTITGIHRVAIDLSDNTTANFYEAGSSYLVAIETITVDAGSISFPLGGFIIGYEGAILDTTIATLSSQTSFTLEDGSTDNSAYVGCPVIIHDLASAVQVAAGVVSAYTGSTKTITLAADPAIFTMAAGDNISFFMPSNTRWAATTLWGSGAITAASIASNAITSAKIAASAIGASQIATDAITAAKIAANAIGASELATDAVNEIVDQVWDEAQADHVAAGSFGVIASEIATIDTNIGTPSDFGSGTSTLSANLEDLADNGTAAYDRATDSLQAIRDRGDAAWTTGAGGSDRLLMVDTTIATLSSQTSFTLTAGSDDDDAYNNCTIVIEDAATSTQKAVGLISDYTGSTKTVTLKYDPGIFTMATTDKVYILAENALKSTDANRQLDVTATGAAGIDWGNVENPTTAVDLSGTDIQLVDTTTTNTDMRGTDNAALASVVGALTDAAAAGDPTTADTVMQYIKQLVNVLVGTTGVTTFPAAAAPANNVSLAEIIRAIYDDTNEIQVDTNSLNDTKIPDTISLAAINAEVDSALDTAIPGVPTANSINERIAAIDDLTQSGGGGDLAAILADTNELQADDYPTALTNIETDTQDIQSRLPAALVNSRMDSTVDDTGMEAGAANKIARLVNPQKNTAYSDIMFPMFDSTNHNPSTGLTVTGVRSIDGGAFGAVTGTIAEIANGVYQIDASQADMNGDNIMFIFSASGADDTFIQVKTAA